MPARTNLGLRAITAAAFSIGLGGIAAGTTLARTDPGFYFDLRVHGTGAKDVTVFGPGDSLTLDLFVTVVGGNNTSSDDVIIDVASNFFTSNGGLTGDLIGLNPPAPFNQLSALPGQQHDFDGDGDFDIGGGSTDADFDSFYFSRGATGQVTPAGGLLLAQIRFTAVQLSAPTTQVGWSTYEVSSPNSTPPLFGLIDGERADGQWNSANVHYSPVTIHADQVFDPGTPTFINGTQSSHLNVTGTLKQGSSATVIVDGGISLAAGSLFDMRDSSNHVNGQQIRVNDLTSSNNGGAAFVDSMIIGQSAPGKFSQNSGYTSIASALTLGSASGTDGSLSVSGGTLRSGSLKVGAGGNGSIFVTGGFLNTTVLDMRAAAGVNSLIDVSDGVFTISSGTLGGDAGNATLRVHDNGRIAVNSTLFVQSNGSGNQGHLEITGGTFQAAMLRPGANTSIEQTGGVASISLLNMITSDNATFTLSNGLLATGGAIIGSISQRATLLQDGGNLTTAGTIYVNHNFQLHDGQVNTATINIAAPAGTAAGLMEQSGGSVVTDSLVVAGTYRITGGSFTVNQNVEIVGDGTIDFANSPAAFRAGPDSLIALPTTAIGNTANAAVRGEVGSLINYPAGYNPAAHFASVSTDGLLHESGAALNIPHGKSITGSGEIVGATTNHGAIHPGYGVGELDITGDYTQAGDGILNIDLSAGGASDLLAVTGQAQLAGELRVALLDGYLPSPDDAFTIITAGALSGKFSNANTQVEFAGGIFDVSYDGGSITLSNFVATPEPGSTMLASIGAMSLLSRRRRAER